MKILGIDIGTTTISAVVADSKNKEVIQAYTVENQSFLKSEKVWEKVQNPQSILEKTSALLENILNEYPDIKSIGLTGQMHGILYVDAQGKAVSPLYTWQDARGNQPLLKGKSLCQILQEDYGKKAYTGYGLITHLYQFMTQKIPRQAVSFCTIMDYLGMALTGQKEALVHTSNAAGFGLFDVQNGCFYEDILEQMGVGNAMLPKITGELSILGTYKEIPVCTAIGDNQASFLGSVENPENSILLNMGTGGQVSVCSEDFYEAEEIEARPYLGNKYLLVGSSLCGGRAYALLESFFRQYAEVLGISGVNHYAVMEHLLRTRKVEEEGLHIDTRFSGTREYPDRRGSIQNIGIDNFTPAAFILGILEGMTEELYEMYQEIEKGLKSPRTQIVGSGNGIRRNSSLQQLMKQRFSMEFHLAEHTEEAALGAAMAGAMAVSQRGISDDLF